MMPDRSLEIGPLTWRVELVSVFRREALRVTVSDLCALICSVSSSCVLGSQGDPCRPGVKDTFRSRLGLAAALSLRSRNARSDLSGTLRILDRVSGRVDVSGS